MVSTPIGAPTSYNQTPVSYPSPLLQSFVNLYSQSQSYPIPQTPTLPQKYPISPPLTQVQSAPQPIIATPPASIQPSNSPPQQTAQMPFYQPTDPYIQNIPNLLGTQPSSPPGQHTFPVLYNAPQLQETDVQPLSLYSEYVDNPYNMSTLVAQESTVETQCTDVINRNSVNLEGVSAEDYNTNMFQSSSYFASDSNTDFISGSEMLFACDKTERRDSGVCDSANIPFVSNPEFKTTTT